jgi:hypothetical protein
VKRVVLSLVLGYLILALISRAKEAVGLLTCDCYPDCWRKKPGLSLFRWVFPPFQHLPVRDEWQQQRLDS